MTTRRKAIRVRNVDYLYALNIVVARLQELGENGHLSRYENGRINEIVEDAAARGATEQSVTAELVALAGWIKTDRGRTLFAPFDDRDNMGDETVVPKLSEVA